MICVITQNMDNISNHRKYLLFYNNNSISITIRLEFKVKQKISYDRETIAALNYEIHQISFISPFPSLQLK